MANNKTTTPKAAKTNGAAATAPLAVLDQFKDLIGYEPHPLKPDAVQQNKPYVKLPYNITAEGMEDLAAEDIPVSFPLVKLLDKQSLEVEQIDDAKPGMLWHTANVEPLPTGLAVVALHTFSIQYPPSERNPEGSNVMCVLFTPLEFLQSYAEWMPRALDPDDFELGREIISNTFVIQYQSTGLAEYKKLQSAAINNGSMYAIAYKLGIKPGQNAKGKWNNVTHTPAARLDANELIVARSLKELARTVHGRMEAYYAKRREAFADVYPETQDGGADTSDI